MATAPASTARMSRGVNPNGCDSSTTSASAVTGPAVCVGNTSVAGTTACRLPVVSYCSKSNTVGSSATGWRLRGRGGR